MYNNILIEYLFLINLINSEIAIDYKLSSNLKGISNEILIAELTYCENEIKNFIQYYTTFNIENNYNKHFELYFKKQNLEIKNYFLKNDFLFNNEIFILKNNSLLNNNSYVLNDLIEKKNNYKFNNNFIIKNLNTKYYLNFFKNNYFNITKTINFIFNIDLISLIENKKNLNITKKLNLINLNSYKNINKNLINKINPIKNNNNEFIYIKFQKNLDFFKFLNLKEKNLDLVKNHFFIMSNLYTTEYNFKILLNFFKTDSYKEFYFKLPINYVTSNICNNLTKSYYNYAPSIDHYLNNLLYDKVIYNQNGNTINESFIFIKKKINNTPLFFNYKFKNKFNYFINKKYNTSINELKSYNLDFFNIAKTKKMTKEVFDLNYIYYAHSNTRTEISRASTKIEYNLPRIRPFIVKSTKRRQFMYDTNITRLLKMNSGATDISYSLFYNHYLYGFFRGGVLSLVNFTQIDMFHNNNDIFFFKGDTFNKQHHYISILNNIVPLRKLTNPLNVDFFWETKSKNTTFFSNNLIYEKTKYERALNLMFNFNEELKPNNTKIEYICNLLFGFLKDNNETYITFKDHYNKNNFIGKHILYRINNFLFNKNLKYSIFYREFLNITNKKSWEEPFFFEKTKNIPYYLHTKNNYIYPNYKVWPVIEDFIVKYYSKKGYKLNYRQITHLYRFLNNDYLIPYSRFLKTGKLSQSIYNKYYNFIPFLYYINNFDFIKKSFNSSKRNDFISFIPKFKIFNFKFFNSVENFKYFEKLNSVLIKFNTNIYINNNQKSDQSIYNLNTNFSNKIINYIPDNFYEKYPTLEWNNKIFFNIINRKLLYKHLINFGDLSNNFIQNLIYNYVKIIFFEEKLKNIFFNRNIFKYKNFENLNDFIKFKINNISSFNKKFDITKNKNFNFLSDYENIKKIIINPYLHIKKHYNIYYIGQERRKTIKWYLYDKSLYDYWLQDRKDYFDSMRESKFHPKHFNYKNLNEMLDAYFTGSNLYDNNNDKLLERFYKGLDVIPDSFRFEDRHFLYNFFFGQYTFHRVRQFYLFFKLHFMVTGASPRCLDYEETLRFRARESLEHINNYNFFLYQIPSNYINYILKNNINNLVIFDKLFSLLLISNLKILSNFQKLDNIFNLDKNFNLFKFFKFEDKINDLNLIKKKTITNYKLYKNKLIEEAGLYNINIINNNHKIKDEDYFLLFNRKRLDNESIYKSWHSTKFLNKKINYYSKNNLFDLEKKIKFFNDYYIFNILKFKNIKYLYKLDYLTTSFYNFFSTDLTFNRNVFHSISSSLFIRNINFTYPQNDIKNIKMFSFVTYIKDKIGFFETDRTLNGTFKNYYIKKKLDRENNFWEFESKYRKTGVYKYGFTRHVSFSQAYKVYLRKYPYFEEFSPFYKIDNFKSNIMPLKVLTKRGQYHNIHKYLSYFQYYGDTRYPKKKDNYKKLNFIFNIYNFQSYFINDRYAFENKNLMSLKQFYNHRTTSDYLRNLIDYKKKEMSKDYYISLNNYNKNNLKMISPYYNLYNLYTPIKIWEIKLSNKLFPYFYSKNLTLNYNIVQYNRLDKTYDNIYQKRSNIKFRKKRKFRFLEYFRYHMFDVGYSKFLNFEKKKNFFSFFFNNFLQNNKEENQLKKKFYINSIGNLINIEYNYYNYKLKKDFFFFNEKYVNNFNFKINNDEITYSYIYNFKNSIPNHLNYKLLYDVYSFDKNFIISKSIKTFKYCILNNFYVKIPYISEFRSKNLYDFFNDKKINFFKLRTLTYNYSLLFNPYEYFFKKPFFFFKPYCHAMKYPYRFDSLNSFINYKNNELNFNKKMLKDKFIFNFNNLNIDEKNILFYKYINKKNLEGQLYINYYYGNNKYLNNNFKLMKKNNNYFFFSKTFDFDKFILKRKNNIFSFTFFNPYDFYIFRYKSSFSSLNNVFFKTNSNSNLRSFINNLFNVKEYKSKNFDLFYELLDKNFWFLLDEELFFLRRRKPIHYNYINKFNYIFKKSSFTLKYYESLSSFNKKKLEELSFFGFLIKNNIIMGVFESNNLYNISYNLKFEKFYVNNNEGNIYSIHKILNTIFILKNKYIWLIFFYYNNLFYFIFNAKKIIEDFLWNPTNLYSYFFFFKIPIILSVDLKLLIVDIFLALYTYFIRILIIFYSWFCVSGEGLINLRDYIIFNHNKIDWNLFHEKYNIYPCDLYGRSLFEMKISRIIFIIFFLSYFIIYIKIIFYLSIILTKLYNLFILNLKRKKNYLFINNKLDLEINNKIHFYFLNYNKFVKNFINSKNSFEIIFLFKSKHSYKYYKSKFKCKLKLPYFLDEASLRRINKIKILTNFETHSYILDIDLKKFRTTLSFLNSSYALFTKTRTIEIGNLLIKGNIKRILYIHQLSNLITYDPILGNSLMNNSMNNLERKDIYFIDKIFLNNQLKIFNLMPLSEENDYIYLPKFIFKNLIKYKFKNINVYYTYNFLFFYFFDSLLTIEGTLLRISNPNFFKALIFFNQNISLRSFSFFF